MQGPELLLYTTNLSSNTFPTAWNLSECKVMAGEDFVAQLTEERSLSDSERAGQQILNDYRAGALGALALEVPKAL